MSRGRELQAGDYALTDFNGKGLTRVRIVQRGGRRDYGHSQSGIMFRVDPPLKGGNSMTWYDADWFEPVPLDALAQLREGK